MITEYQIQSASKVCSVSGRELKPGEKYFSQLMLEAGRFVRLDFSSEAWPGPKPDAFSYWSGRIPTNNARKSLPIDDELLLDCLRRLEATPVPAQVQFRYIVALLLMRRKKLKLIDITGTGSAEVMKFRCSRTQQEFLVPNPQMTEDEMLSVQEEVLRVLGWE